MIAGTAQQVVADAGATTPYAQAAALRDYFWANYTYDLDVDPQRRHEHDRELHLGDSAASACSSRAPSR